MIKAKNKVNVKFTLGKSVTSPSVRSLFNEAEIAYIFEQHFSRHENTEVTPGLISIIEVYTTRKGQVYVTTDFQDRTTYMTMVDGYSYRSNNLVFQDELVKVTQEAQVVLYKFIKKVTDSTITKEDFETEVMLFLRTLANCMGLAFDEYATIYADDTGILLSDDLLIKMSYDEDSLEYSGSEGMDDLKGYREYLLYLPHFLSPGSAKNMIEILAGHRWDIRLFKKNRQAQKRE